MRTRGANWRRYRSVAVGLLLLFSGGSSWASDLGGRAILSYQDSRAGDAAFKEFRQDYELRYQRTVAPPFQYVFRLQWQDTMGKVEANNSRFDLRTKVFQPSLEFVINVAPFEFRTNIEFKRTDYDPDPGKDHTQDDTRFFSRLHWRPDNLPSVLFQLDRRTSKDPAVSLDTAETQFNTLAEYKKEPFRFLYRFQYDKFDNKAIHFTKEEMDHQGEVDYRQAFLDNRLTFSANYLVDYRSVTDKVRGDLPVTVPIQLTPLKGLSSVDDTPLDGTDRPMASNSLLIDGLLGIPAGISIGSPGGVPLNNVGIDLGRRQTADRVVITVRNARMEPVPIGGPVSWDVYASADGVRWTLVAAGASTVFSAVLSQYEIRFPPTVSQFFKVVNIGVNTVDTQVTEMQLLADTTFLPGGEVSGTFLSQTGNVTTEGKPVKGVTLTYNAYIRAIRDESPGRPEYTSNDWTQAVSAFLEPARFTNLTLRYDKRKQTQNIGDDQGSDLYSATANFFFLQNLYQSLLATRGSQQVNGADRSLSETLAFRNNAKLYDTWEVNFDMGYGRDWNYQFADNTTKTDRYAVNLRSLAQLTRRLLWTVEGNANWVTTAYSGGESKTRDARGWTEFFYRPGQEIDVTARVGYVNGTTQSGPTQRYKVNWYPFPDGAVQLNGTYEYDRDDSSGNLLERWTALARWNVNRYTTLELNYTNVETSYTYFSRLQWLTGTVKSQTIYTTLNINLL
jgi:hypothetical protein